MITEKLFFKKRNIYVTPSANHYLNDEGEANFDFFVIHHYSDWEEKASAFSVEQADNSEYAINEKLYEDHFHLFLLVDPVRQELAASYWAFVPAKDVQWHDSFKVQPGEALLCHAFVEPQYRKKGLYGKLIRLSHQVLLNEKKCKCVYTIVEQSNKASDSVNRKYYGEVSAVNYLIKFLSINLISVIKSEAKTKVYVPLLGWKIYET